MKWQKYDLLTKINEKLYVHFAELIRFLSRYLLQLIPSLTMNLQKVIGLALAGVFMLALAAPLEAQSSWRSSRNRKKKEETSLKDRLWYGAGIQLGFGGLPGQSQFAFGLSPMAGYKVLPILSVGPRLSVLYSSIKIQNVANLNLFDTEAGAFTRVKVFRGLFLQGEITNQWIQEPGDIINNRFTKFTYTRFNQYAGIGWNTGGGPGSFGSEVGAYYNFGLANDIASSQSPWQIRFGFTYGF